MSGDPAGEADLCFLFFLFFFKLCNWISAIRLGLLAPGFGQVADLQKAMQSAESSHMNKKELAKLKSMADSLEQSAATAMSPGDSARLHALAEILKHPAA